MHPITLLLLLGSLAGGALAACDASCPPYTVRICDVDASSNNCLAPASVLKAKRFFSPPLLRRDCNDCPPAECASENKVCTPGGQGPPQLPETKVLFDCGQHQTDKFVTVTLENCPDDASQKCLVFRLSDPALEAPKLEISSSHLDNSAPGQFSYYNPVNYCTATSCVVPIEVILAKEGKTELCGLELWIGLHSGYGGDTCWPQGSDINDGNNNWAQEFSITFQCPTVPEVCCCCKPTTPKPDKKCGSETAYASNADYTKSLSATGCTKAWGYYQQYDAGYVNSLAVGSQVYRADLLAGKTTDVGDVVVTKTSNICFSVSLDAAAKYGVGVTHIDISCKAPQENLGSFCRTPGQYEFNSGCIDADPYVTPNICVDTQCTTGSYYFIIHAETYNVVSYDAANPGPYDSCVPYVCES